MTKDTFVKIVRTIVDGKAHITASKESKLSALARRYSERKATIPEVLEELRDLFSDDFGLGRHEYAEIEKRLTRY